MGSQILRVGLVLGLALSAWSCGDTRPDGDCLTDFDCELDQLCGQTGRCLLCANCDRGRVGTCTVPAYPIDTAPDTIRLEDAGDGELLIYVYECAAGRSEFSYRRGADEACFDPEPSTSDGCELL